MNVHNNILDQSNKPPMSTSSSGSGAFSTGFGASYLAAAGALVAAGAGVEAICYFCTYLPPPPNESVPTFFNPSVMTS